MAADVIGKRRCALFGHVVRLDAATPAHQALKQVIATKAGHCPGTNWRRPPGHPRKTWIMDSYRSPCMDTADRRRNKGQLETDVAGRRGTWTSWRVVATDHCCLRAMIMMMMMRHNVPNSD